MQATRDFSHYVKDAGAGLQHIDLAVEGVSCAGCMSKIERGLSAIPDVTLARVNLTDRRVALEWKQGTLDPARFIDRLAELGYKAYPFETAGAEAAEAEHSRFLLRCLGVAAFATMNVMMLSIPVWSGNGSDMMPEQRDFFHWLSALIALPAAAYAGQPFFRSAFRALRTGNVNMDVPISIGVILALGMSVVETVNHAEHTYFDAAIMLLTFLLVGRYLDQSMRRRTRAVAGNLAALKAETATKFVGADEISQVPVAAIVPGDIVLLRPGERCAVDGTVIEGRSEIDQSLITGETLYVTAEHGTPVYAGSLNISGTLRVRVSAASEGTLLAEITRLLDNALQARSRYVRLADRASRLYAPVVHATALLTMLGWVLVGRELARRHRHRHRGSHHHLPLRARACDPDGADRRLGRDVQGRRPAQFRRCDRAAGRGRSCHLRQDRNPDAARSRSRERCRHSRRRASRSPASLRWRAIIRSPPRWRRRPARNRRWPAPSKCRGRACAACSAEPRCRLGRPSFCGAEQLANERAKLDPEASIVAFSLGEAKYVFAVRQGLRPDARGDDRSAAEAQHSSSKFSRATANRRCGRRRKRSVSANGGPA